MVDGLKDLPAKAPYGQNDTLVVFGEIFSRGYVNGLVDVAKAQGMKVLEGTVGRRDAEGKLRPLTSEEIQSKEGDVINVPLEAGFDLTPSSKGLSPADQLKGLKMSEWETAALDPEQMQESLLAARESFRQRVKEYVKALRPRLNTSKNILIAHTMAGGVPRTKIVMPVMNRVFKGRGDRFLSSEAFWKSELGSFCAKNFMEVTAHTLDVLIEETGALRQEVEAKGGQVSYVAYGYHGTEVLIEGEYRWQTYTPYLQGWAKLELENIAKKHFGQGVAVSVYNCPEILTNSSSIFQGLEVSLYPMLGALQKEESAYTHKILKACLAKLKDGKGVEQVLEFTDRYLTHPVLLKHSSLEKWPQHNSPEHMGLMLTSSEELASWHKDEKDPCNPLLSEEIFKATGPLMLHEAFKPRKPVWWLGHDILARQMTQFQV